MQELVELHGGKLMPGCSHLPQNFRQEELDELWELVRQDPRGWNESVGYLNEFESKSDTKDPVVLPLKLLRLFPPTTKESKVYFGFKCAFSIACVKEESLLSMTGSFCSGVI